MNAIMFKTEASLWNLMAQGRRDWDARLADADALQDPRIQLLLQQNKMPPRTLKVMFWNKETRAVIACWVKFVHTDIIFMPHWLVMELEVDYIWSGTSEFRPEPWESVRQKS